MRLRVKGYIYIGSNATEDNLTSDSFIWRVFSRCHASLKTSRIFSATRRISKTIRFPPAALLRSITPRNRRLAQTGSRWVMSSNRTSLHAHMYRVSCGPCLIISRPNVWHRTRRDVMERDDLFVEGAPARSRSMSLSGILFLPPSFSLHSPDPRFSTGHRETSRDSRTNRVFLGRANSPSCATWLVVARIPVNNARVSPSGYFPGINYARQEFCDEAVVKRCARPQFLNAEIFFSSETRISKSVLVY